MIDVVGIGTSFMDQLVNVSRLPQGNGGVRADEVFHQGGGNVATAIAAAARLGARAGMMGRVGGDSTGDFLIRDFIYNGVDTSRLLRGESGSSSPYSIAVSERELGTRMFIIRQGTAAPLRPEDLDLDYIAAARILHLETGDPASMAAAEFARKHGVTVTLDAGDYTEDRLNLIPLVDILIASQMFYDGMFGEGGKEGYRGNIGKLLAMGPRVAWVTRGAEGCVGMAEGEYLEVPTFDTPVTDTTGAGDVFHGAYIAAMLEGLPHRECARYANAVSSIKCMFVGGRTGIPNRQTLARFLEDGTADSAEIEERLAYYRRNFPSVPSS
jgi:sugar/nucleoside kinase (ribokinase family)